ncbi:MAG: PQQ-dependent sugar dehydrogenase, partial [Acidiferrobacterales bacterium]
HMQPTMMKIRARINTTICGVTIVFVQASYAACLEQSASHSIPSIALKEVVRGLKNPVHLANAGDGSGRLYVVEQQGVIRVIENGRLQSRPFLDIRDRVNSGGEKGLLSVAFHPKYRDNGQFYVNYTTRNRGLHTIVAEHRRRTKDRADPVSERVLLQIKQPYGNHNGGQLAFGPDGYLYIGMGDGGAANDPFNHGQQTQTLLGAMLRIDVDRRTGGHAYGIPADNPFVGKVLARDEIWAYGLRNPWRFSFDAGSGLLFVADVGQNHQEEIDVIKKGRNYGWNTMEGTICTPGVNFNCDKSGLELPIFSYPQPEGFSITGGFVYRGKAISALCGTYIYGDYVSQRVWGLRYNGRQVTRQRQLLKTRHAISSFGEDEAFELYMVDHGGKVMKIVAADRRR